MGMFRQRNRWPARALPIDQDMVRCPLVSGDKVDLERCYACGLLERLGSTDGQDWITCQATKARTDPFFGSIPS